jgi:hypothetical protein
MAKSRVLSADEASQLGLPPASEASAKSTAKSRVLSADEAKALGLPPAEQAPTQAPEQDPGPLSPASTTGAAAHGLVQGGTLGFGDELYGALSADIDQRERMQQIADDIDKAKADGLYGDVIQPPPQTTWQLKRPGQPVQTLVRPASSPNDAESRLGSWLKDYINGRDSMRKDDSTAEAAHPYAYGGGELVGSLAVPVPGAGEAKGLARVGKFALQGATLGGLSAAGHSTADNALDLAKDTGGGAALSAPLGVAGGFAGDKLAARGVAAQQAARDNATKLAEHGFASARGALGGETSSAARTLELLEKAATDPNVPEDLSRAASDMLSSPEGQALKAQVVRSSAARFPDQLSRIQGARDAMTEAATHLEPAAIDKATNDALSPGAAARALTSRAKTLGERAIPIALGQALGGPAGLAAGAVTSGVIGRPRYHRRERDEESGSAVPVLPARHAAHPRGDLGGRAGGRPQSVGRPRRAGALPRAHPRAEGRRPMTALEQAAANFCAQLVDAHRQHTTGVAEARAAAREAGSQFTVAQLAAGSLATQLDEAEKRVMRSVDRLERKVDALLRATRLNPEDFVNG